MFDWLFWFYFDGDVVRVIVYKFVSWYLWYVGGINIVKGVWWKFFCGWLCFWVFVEGWVGGGVVLVLEIGRFGCNGVVYDNF